MPENNIADKERALGGVTVDEQDAKRLEAARGQLDELIRERHGLSSGREGTIEVEQRDIHPPEPLVRDVIPEKQFPMDERGYVIERGVVPIDLSRRLVKLRRARTFQKAA